MVKKIKKYLKFVVCCTLIMSLIAPSYAALSASDGSAFVTKAEFDGALADFNSRLTTFEAGINSKIDSQVTSYLDRNGIWSGVDQTFILPRQNNSTYWSITGYGGSTCMTPILGPCTKSGLLFLNLPCAWAPEGMNYDYWFLCSLVLPGWDSNKFQNYIDWFTNAEPGTSNSSLLSGTTIEKVKKCCITGTDGDVYWCNNGRLDAQVYQQLAGVPTILTAVQIASSAHSKKQFTILPSFANVATGARGSVVSSIGQGLKGGWDSAYTNFTNFSGQGTSRMVDTQLFVSKGDIVWLDNYGYWSLWLDKQNPALFGTTSRDYGTRAMAMIY